MLLNKSKPLVSFRFTDFTLVTQNQGKKNQVNWGYIVNAMSTNRIAYTKYIVDYLTKLLSFTNAHKNYQFNS